VTPAEFRARQIERWLVAAIKDDREIADAEIARYLALVGEPHPVIADYLAKPPKPRKTGQGRPHRRYTWNDWMRRWTIGHSYDGVYESFEAGQDEANFQLLRDIAPDEATAARAIAAIKTVRAGPSKARADKVARWKDRHKPDEAERRLYHRKAIQFLVEWYNLGTGKGRPIGAKAVAALVTRHRKKYRRTF
jgi:hypothetical protein